MQIPDRKAKEIADTLFRIANAETHPDAGIPLADYLYDQLQYRPPTKGTQCKQTKRSNT